jgi:hypothetical protein
VGDKGGQCVGQTRIAFLYHRSPYRYGQALSVPGGSGYPISTHSAHESGKFFSPTHRPPLPRKKYSWYSFLLEAESIPGKDYVNKKIPVTPSAIEPATFQIVAPCQCSHRVPLLHLYNSIHIARTAEHPTRHVIITWDRKIPRVPNLFRKIERQAFLVRQLKRMRRRLFQTQIQKL